MSKMVIRGGHLVSPLEDRLTDLTISDGLIEQLGPLSESEFKTGAYELVDAAGCWVTPGLIDLQVNGGPQCDFWATPDRASLSAFATSLANAGVTTILPTLITADLDHLCKNIAFLEKDMGVGAAQLEAKAESALIPKGGDRAKLAVVPEPSLPVRMPGIHLEGPCLSPERPGVHPLECLQPLRLDVVQRLSSSAVKLMTLAPELDSSGAAIDFLIDKGINVAIGHSNATFEQAEEAFDRGVTLMTHTFNALPAVHHRAPGAVTAALLDERITCCAIADGKHLSVPAIKLILKAKGVNKTVLVTDIAHVGTSQGGLVGSSILLSEAVVNTVRWGIAGFQQAIQMATLNPALAMGWQDRLGSLAAGMLADIVIWDKETLAIKKVIAGGKLVYRS